MGVTNASANTLASYDIQEVGEGFKIAYKPDSFKQRYLIKTYSSALQEQHQQKYRYFCSYKQKMKENEEIMKLLEVIEETNEQFCNNIYKIHLIFEYSHLNITKEIRQRLKYRSKKANKNQHFTYEDLCNIFYSCLSTLWIVKNLNYQQMPDEELLYYKNAFISTDNILIFPQGIIKIMDPFTMGFRARYQFNKHTHYSPEKLTNFDLIDDEKCSLFEVGRVLIEIALLQGHKLSENDKQQAEQNLKIKINECKSLYQRDIENKELHLFDIIEKLLEIDREERLNLYEAIQVAEQMYDINQIEESSTPNSKISHKEIPSTNDEIPSRSKSNNFCSFKNGLVESIYEDHMLQSLNPKISNFTIEEVEAEKEELSQIESLKVQNIEQKQSINESLISNGIFQAISIENSETKNNKLRQYWNFNEDMKLFTDPELLNSIQKELKEIEKRRQRKLQDSKLLIESLIVDKQARPILQDSIRITNKVYLR